MEDLKIKVNGNIDELVDLFKALGCKFFNHTGSKLNYMFFENGSVYFCKLKKNFDESKCKEITIQELKDLVVLKRNCVEDANFENKVTSIKYFVSSVGEIYFWGGNWEKCHPSIKIENLEPIKEVVMKKYLVKTDSGGYLYTKNVRDIAADRVIEVPDGATIYGRNKLCGVTEFYKNDGQHGLLKINKEDGNWFRSNYHAGNIVSYWQREKESIIDKLVYENLPEFKHGVEVTLAERQAQYGCFEDVAFVTENIMSVLSKVRTNGLNDLPHPHRMALYMIASKMARIVNGDFNHKDSWHDIGGYSKLIEDLI